MDFDQADSVDTSQIEDRRGASSGVRGGTLALGAGGLGAVGTIVMLVLNLLGGGGGGVPGFNVNQVLGGVPAADTNTPATPLGTSCKGVTSSTDDATFVSCVSTNVQTFWSQTFSASGQTYTPAKLVLFTTATSSSCGTASADTGPFYCPPDKRVYLDTGFFDELSSRFGAQGGDFAQAYVVAHEIAHHVQSLLGIESQVRDKQQANPSQQNALSVRLELQADCFAGVWGHSAYSSGKVQQSEIKQALDAAAAVGDDRIQKASTGRINESAFTHGSAAQRQKWFQKGFDTGDPEQCDTFSGSI